MAVFLVGFMGAGKSSVGQALGRHLNWVFEDLDDRIERAQGRTVAQIFRALGESEFRRAEQSALQDVLADLRASARRIIALGGGAFVQKANAASLKAAGVPTVFLDAPVKELWRRCQKQASESGTERPLLGNETMFRALHKNRRLHYLKASLRVQTAGRSVAEIAKEIAESLGLNCRGQERDQEGEAD
jgi:shikimate kinase